MDLSCSNVKQWELGPSVYIGTQFTWSWVEKSISAFKVMVTEWLM